jgi:hypothetical protein
LASKPDPLESQLIDFSIAVVGQLMPMLGQISMPINSLILGPVLFAILITVWRDVTGADQLIDSDRNHNEPSG